MSILKIQTKVDVTHIDVTGIITGATKSGIVQMEMGGRYFALQPDGTETTEVMFKYIDEDGNVLPNAKGNKITLDNASQLSEQMQNTGTSFKDHFDKDVLAFAINEMAQTFSINTTDVEII